MPDALNPLAEFQKQFASYLLQENLQPGLEFNAGFAAGHEPTRTRCGLQVYRNNVIYSLTQALSAQFPVVRRLVGATFFGALARDYVRSEPPREPSLGLYGHRFPEYIAAHPACPTLPYLPDVAALELHCQRALHAAADPVLDLNQFGTLPQELLGLAHLQLQAAAVLFASNYPVDRIRDANLAESDEAIHIEADGVHYLLVYRPGLEARVVALEAPAFLLLQQLQQGQCLQDACAEVQRRCVFNAAEFTALLGYLFGLQVFSCYSLDDKGNIP